MWRREEVLDTYALPYDPAFPVVCLDEKSVQLLDHVYDPLPCAPGLPARVDHEYIRCGTANLFVELEPLRGERIVTVTQRRAAEDYVQRLKALDQRFPAAKKIRLVQDQVSTHSPAALYQYLPAQEARRLYQRFEWIYTPKHASWLNMAEVEWSVLERQCLGQRIASSEELERQVKAWEAQRNAKRVMVDWQFTTQKARTKLQRHYPANQ